MTASPVAPDRQYQECAELCSAEVAQLRSNIEAHAWDGDWDRQAWFDDGIPLGSTNNDKCQIDSISQSWAVISKAATGKGPAGQLWLWASAWCVATSR